MDEQTRLKLLPRVGTPFQGRSKSAARRRAERSRGTLYVPHQVGQLIEMSRGTYRVHKDGSLRRVA